MLRLLLVASGALAAGACSAYAAGKDATADGSVMVSHSDDGDGTSDARMSYIPAADWPAGSARPIWPDTESYPRFVGHSRGSTYAPILGQPATQPIGSIPQVNHTLGYYEANYGIQNECQLMFGESTAAAVFTAGVAVGKGGSALFSVNELTRVAMERVCTAREAIALMGGLAEVHGFYGADGGAGETLMVGDAAEAFVFHILSDPTGKSAIWAAQRVPDDAVTVVANMFTIREVNLTDTRDFMASANLAPIAIAHKLWDGKGLLDFTATYSRGEYAHKYYSGRRMWDGLRHFKPSLVLPAEYGDLKTDKPSRPWGRSTYPWSVVPDAKLGPRDWMAAHRSHYEGTPYDTTQGLAAGAFGTPDRYPTVGAAGDPGVGTWERTVSIYRTTYTWIVQADRALGTVWWGAGDSSKTTFLPLMVQAGELPPSVTVGRQSKLERSSAYWATRYLGNLAQIRYAEMIADIAAAAHKWEAEAVALQAALAKAGRDPAGAKLALDRHAAAVLASQWQLADDLMLKWADGQLTVPKPDGSVECSPLGYPKAWLTDKEVNFTSGPARLPGPAAGLRADQPH